jgi:hypothetical protein
MASDRPAGTTVLQGGRAKAYRPLPASERAAALDAGLAAFERGDFFEAHELLEPAWMGSADLFERELHQGLIKMAAAWVHAARGNRLGMRKNLDGALARLAAVTGAPDVGGWVDVSDLLAQLRDRSRRLADDAVSLDALLADPPTIRRRNP